MSLQERCMEVDLELTWESGVSCSKYVQAVLLDSTSAPPGAVHHLSHHSAEVIATLFGDLDAAALVHAAATEAPQNGTIHSYTAAGKAVKNFESQFLVFRHRPLNTASSSRSMIENASTGTWMSKYVPMLCRSAASLCMMVPHIFAIRDGLNLIQFAAGDWLAWGAACERLKCLKHAEYSYMRALSSVHPHRCLTGHLSLARLLSAQSDIHTVFDHLTEVLLHLDCRKEQQQGQSNSETVSVVKEGEVPAAVVCALVTVTSSWGMSAVQSRLEKGVGQYHPSIEAVVEQAFEWGTDGCDM